MSHELDRFQKIQNNSVIFRQELQKLKHFKVIGVDQSPVFHLRIRHPELLSFKPGEVLEKVVNMSREKGVVVTKAACLEEQELFPPEPSIRIAASSDLTEDEIRRVVQTLQEVSNEIF